MEVFTYLLLFSFALFLLTYYFTSYYFVFQKMATEKLGRFLLAGLLLLHLSSEIGELCCLLYRYLCAKVGMMKL